MRAHAHFHVIARYADQPDDKRGPGVFDYLGVPDDQRVTEQVMNILALDCLLVERARQAGQ